MRPLRICAGIFLICTGAAWPVRGWAESLDPGSPAELRDAQTLVARRMLELGSETITYRRGCVPYHYGCGYGTLAGDRPAISKNQENKTRW